MAIVAAGLVVIPAAGHGVAPPGGPLTPSLSTSAAAPVARGRGRIPGWTWYETQVWRLTNAVRAHAGLKPLMPNSCLRGVADSWSAYLNDRGTLTHGNVPARLRRCQEFRHYAGENVAYGYPTPAGLVAAWMNSPHHRENLLDPRFRYLGVGTDGSDPIYTSQVFAARVTP